jgi:hypothetical protein
MMFVLEEAAIPILFLISYNKGLCINLQVFSLMKKPLLHIKVWK